ncbi:hypothetical protein MM5_149 [Morganella phage vB_Mm5]
MAKLYTVNSFGLHALKKYFKQQHIVFLGYGGSSTIFDVNRMVELLAFPFSVSRDIKGGIVAINTHNGESYTTGYDERYSDDVIPTDLTLIPRHLFEYVESQHGTHFNGSSYNVKDRPKIVSPDMVFEKDCIYKLPKRNRRPFALYKNCGVACSRNFRKVLSGSKFQVIDVENGFVKTIRVIEPGRIESNNVLHSIHRNEHQSLYIHLNDTTSVLFEQVKEKTESEKMSMRLESLKSEKTSIATQIESLHNRYNEIDKTIKEIEAKHNKLRVDELINKLSDPEFADKVFLAIAGIEQ